MLAVKFFVALTIVAFISIWISGMIFSPSFGVVMSISAVLGLITVVYAVLRPEERKIIQLLLYTAL